MFARQVAESVAAFSADIALDITIPRKADAILPYSLRRTCIPPAFCRLHDDDTSNRSSSPSLKKPSRSSSARMAPLMGSDWKSAEPSGEVFPSRPNAFLSSLERKERSASSFSNALRMKLETSSPLASVTRFNSSCNSDVSLTQTCLARFRITTPD